MACQEQVQPYPNRLGFFLRMSLLRFHTSSLSDTTVAAPTKKMDPATTYLVIVALFFAAGVLEIGVRPCGNQNFTTPSTRRMNLQVAVGCGGKPCGRASRG